MISSCTMWLVHIIAITGLAITSGCMGSRGVSKVVAGDGSLCRQAVTSLKLRGSAISCTGSGDLGGDAESCSACLTCWNSSALWHLALLSPELWLQCLCLDFLRARGVWPAAVTGWEGCSTFLQLGNWLGEASTFVHPSHVTWGVVSSSIGPPKGVASLTATSVGTAFSTGSSLVGTSVKASWAFLGTVTLVQSSRNPSSGATLSKMVSSEKDMYRSIVPLSSRAHLTKRYGWPSIGRLDFSAQYRRACT